MSSNEARLAEIRARLNAATEGPWESIDLDYEFNGERMNGGRGWWWVWQTAKRPYYAGVLEAEQDYTIAGEDGRTYHVAGAVGTVVADDGEGSDQEQADATFLAGARSDIPWLLDLIVQHEATIYQLESVLAEVTNVVDPIQVRGDLKSGWNMLRKEIRHALGINDG